MKLSIKEFSHGLFTTLLNGVYLLIISTLIAGGTILLISLYSIMVLNNFNIIVPLHIVLALSSFRYIFYFTYNSSLLRLNVFLNKNQIPHLINYEFSSILMYIGIFIFSIVFDSVTIDKGPPFDVGRYINSIAEYQYEERSK